MPPRAPWETEARSPASARVADSEAFQRSGLCQLELRGLSAPAGAPPRTSPLANPNPDPNPSPNPNLAPDPKSHPHQVKTSKDIAYDFARTYRAWRNTSAMSTGRAWLYDAWRRAQAHCMAWHTCTLAHAHAQHVHSMACAWCVRVGCMACHARGGRMTWA